MQQTTVQICAIETGVGEHGDIMTLSERTSREYGSQECPFIGIQNGFRIHR